MKGILHKSSNQIRFIVEDTETVSIESDLVLMSDRKILDLNSSNAEVVQLQFVPEDWASDKYFWKNNTWELNPDWTEPVVEEPVVEEPVEEEPAA